MFQSFRDSSFTFLIWTLSILGALETMYGYLQVLELDPISWNNPYGLIIGTVGNADFAGALIAICGVATLWPVYFQPLNKYYKLLLSGLVLCEVYLVYISNIRQALIIFLSGFSIFTLWKLKSMSRKLFLLFSLAMSTSIILIVSAIFQVGPLTSYVYKLSISMRGDYWRAALRMFLDHPLTGVGLGNFGDKFPMYRDSIQVSRRGPNYVADASHSVFLDFLSMGGILLFLAYAALVVLGFWHVFSKFKSLSSDSQNIRIGFAAIWISYLAQSLISLDQIGLAIWGWIFIGAALSFGRRDSAQTTHKAISSGFVSALVLVFGSLSILIVAPTWNADLSLKKAMIIGTQNRTAEAAAARLQLLKESTAYDPQNSWYFQNAALILLQSGQVEGIDFAKKALELNPNDILSAKLISMVSADIGRKDESEKYARIVRELDPFSNF
jgi:tetratricopeptide (TPR) repeat protein